MWDMGNLYGNSDTGTFGETFGDQSQPQPAMGMPMQQPRARANRQFGNGNPFFNANGQLRNRFTQQPNINRWAQRQNAGAYGNAGNAWNFSGMPMQQQQFGVGMNNYNQRQMGRANNYRQTAWAMGQQGNYGQGMMGPNMPYMGDQQPQMGY
jgi:hypothetical protein